MGVHSFEALRFHVGHQLECVMYGDAVNVSVECLDCGCVLLDFDRPPEDQRPPVLVARWRHETP